MKKTTEIMMSLAKGIQEKYDSIFQNSGNIGTEREKKLMGFLRSILPRKYGLGCGEVIDKEENNCGQTDIVIYDDLYSCRFSDGSGNSVFLYNGTFGIIEVKSTLTTDERNKAVEKIKKYQNLKQDTPSNKIYIAPDYQISCGNGINVSGENYEKISVIFGFDSALSADNILKKIKDENIDVDCIIVPGKFCYIGKNKGFSISQEGRVIEKYMVQGDKSLCLGILYLQNILPKLKTLHYDFGGEFVEIVNHIIEESKSNS